MDTNDFELLFRQTGFGYSLLSEYWKTLNSARKVGLLARLVEKSYGIPHDVSDDASRDPNPLIRMLAAKGSYIEEDTELFDQVTNDEAPMVRATLKCGFFINADDFLPLSHEEKLGVIALEESLSEEAFSGFILDGLKKKTLTEVEARELVTEFVRNPKLLHGISRNEVDGLDWYGIGKQFEAIWNLTTCTAQLVHHRIMWEYPLRAGSRTMGHDIPDEMLLRMDTHVLEALAFRQCEPLLDQLDKTPDKFDQKVHDAARNGADFGPTQEDTEMDSEETEIKLLKEEFEVFRQEMRDQLKELEKAILGLSSRRRGLFR